MTDPIVVAGISAVASGIVSGLLAYGGLRVKLQYMADAIKEARERAERAEKIAQRAVTVLEVKGLI